jgi:hypothetical protein
MPRVRIEGMDGLLGRCRRVRATPGADLAGPEAAAEGGGDVTIHWSIALLLCALAGLVGVALGRDRGWDDGFRSGRDAGRREGRDEEGNHDIRNG